MPTLALNLLVLNGESCLPRMLRSLGYAIDELVVVDTGSTDNTLEILRSFAASRNLRFACHRLTPEIFPELFFHDSPEIFPASWQPTNRYLLADWAFARNLALNDTNSDYALKLDADDELYEPLTHKRVSSLIDFFVKHISKTFISANYDIMDKDQIAQKQLYVRLWRNLPTVRWQQPMHEYLSGKTYENTFAYPSPYGILSTRDWRDSTGLGTRVPYRNLKTLEWYRLTHPWAMEDATFAGLMFRYTWATEMVTMQPADARTELLKILAFDVYNDQGIWPDLYFQIGRTYEVEGNIEQATRYYSKAASSNFLASHIPSLIQLVTMLDTAELRGHNSDLLEMAKTKLGLVAKGELPPGCDLQALAKITG